MLTAVGNMKKDPFCWKCHNHNPSINCVSCPRSFHYKCAKHFDDTNDWVCPVCNEEASKERSPALQKLSPEQFSNLLKFTMKRMKQIEGSESFAVPAIENVFLGYNKYVVKPQDLTSLEKNIDADIYRSTQAFKADVQWILHNSIICNSKYKRTLIAKQIMKTCQEDMNEIEACITCYLNANTKVDWFVDVCPKPHLVVWAKLKGYPYWPAKVIRITSLGVDVRFFGKHERARLSCKDCFLYCLKDPNKYKRRHNKISESIEELNIYIENLKGIYGEFCYAQYKSPVDPTVEQLKLLLPHYDPKNIKPNKSSPRSLLQNNNLNSGFKNSQENKAEILCKIKENFADVSSDNISEEHLTEPNCNDDMQNTFINTTDPETFRISRKRSYYDADDNPVKLSRCNSYKNINSGKDETLNEVRDFSCIPYFIPGIADPTCSTERPEAINFELPINMDNIVHTTDISTFSVSPFEYEIDSVSKPIQKHMEEAQAAYGLNLLDKNKDFQIVSPPTVTTNPEETIVETRTVHDTQKEELEPKFESIDKIILKQLNSPSAPTTTISSTMDNNLDSTGSVTLPLQLSDSMLERQLGPFNKTSDHPDNCGAMFLNNEASLGNEQIDKTNELKREYLLALNIAEKQSEAPDQSVSMRTRSKSQQHKFKFFGSTSKIKDGFDSNCEVDVDTSNLPLKRNEIVPKLLSNMLPKKTSIATVKNAYPASLHMENVGISKPIAPAPSMASVRYATPLIKPCDPPLFPSFSLYSSCPTSIANEVLQPTQPIPYSANQNSPVHAMEQYSNNLPSTSAERYQFQNYISLSGERDRNTNLNQTLSATLESIIENVITHTPPAVTSTINTSCIDSSVVSETADVIHGLLEDIATTSYLTPESRNKILMDMREASSKLKSRSHELFTANIEESLPHSVGSVNSILTSASLHKLTDYFRGLIMAVLDEASGNGCLEAEIIKLKLEEEALIHRHKTEMEELKKNVNSFLHDVVKSMENENARIKETIRSVYEAEAIKRIDEVKRKQWCSNCSKEATLFTTCWKACCWNIHYCSFICRDTHRSKHMPKCAKKNKNSPHLQSAGVTTASAVNSTQLLLQQIPPALTSLPSYITSLELTQENSELISIGKTTTADGNIISRLSVIPAQTKQHP